MLRGYRRVIVPEMNLGQLSMLLRARYLVDVQGHNQVRGLPFTTHELVDVITRATTALDAPSGHDDRPVDVTTAGPAAPEEEAS